MAQRRLNRPGWKILGALALGVLLWTGGPRVLGTMDFFRARRVEVRGYVQYRAAEIARALPLRPDQSIFDDLGAIRAAAESLPGLRSVQVSRRLPGTVVVTVQEEAPVALVMFQGRLVPVSEEGTVLPFDPTAAATDLPVVRGADSLVTRLLARVRDADATLFAQVTSGWRSGEDVVLEVGGGRYLFRAGATAREFEAVTVVARELERRGRHWGELDARFTGQVVVRGVPA